MERSFEAGVFSARREVDAFERLVNRGDNGIAARRSDDNCGDDGRFMIRFLQWVGRHLSRRFNSSDDRIGWKCGYAPVSS
jgi:hypothetical protein